MSTKRPSGGQRTAAARVARMRERQQQEGLKRVEVMVPAPRVEEIRDIAAKMRLEEEQKE